MSLTRRSAPMLLLVLMTLLISGCGGRVKDGAYAATESVDRYGISGLAVFEKLCNQAGIKFFGATRLSPRLEKADCILLVGDTFHPPAKDARDWLENWLSRKPGRCIVYFGRDFSADVFYRTQTLGKVKSESARRAAVELASARARHDSELVSELSGDVFCRWFEIKWSGRQRDIKNFVGPWSAGMNSTGTWPVRVWLDIPDSDRMATKPTWVAAPTVTTWPGWGQATTPRGRNQTRAKNVIYQSSWSPTDINDDATWASEWDKAPDAEALLSGPDGTPLVTRLTSDRYPGSQIITLVNAAPLLNASIVQPHFMQVSQRLIAQMGSASRMAILRYDRSGIAISELADREDEVAGLSVLTTYPINIIIVHLAFLGLIICLALFPILGRAQKLPAEPVSDFGQHAQALGQMLRRTGDLQYATKTVADYVQIVRGEALPAWLQSALVRFFPPEPSPTTAGSTTSGINGNVSSKVDPAVDTTVDAPVDPARAPTVQSKEPPASSSSQ